MLVNLAVMLVNANSVAAGARNHLPANRSVSFCFEIPI